VGTSDNFHAKCALLVTLGLSFGQVDAYERDSTSHRRYEKNE